tara:strand:+ start:7140 stop:7361 length:222 start_codon:yes stop_codon:yes gene_type:complete
MSEALNTLREVSTARGEKLLTAWGLAEDATFDVPTAASLLADLFHTFQARGLHIPEVTGIAESVWKDEYEETL